MAEARVCRQCGSAELLPRRQLCEPCRATPPLRCKKCKKVKPLTRFSHDASRPSGYFPWCMDCQLAGVKAGAFQNPEDELNGNVCPLDDVPIRGHANRRFCSNTCKDRAARLKHHYNLTPKQFRAMVDATGGVCPICTKRSTSWQVDHDHSTLRVMGVVCIACNTGSLASTYHDVAYVRRLLAFLESPPALAVGVDVLASVEHNKPSQLHKTWGHRKIRTKGEQR